jgi:hypothetical protein
MAEYKFLAALNAVAAPLVTRFQPRSVVISGLDNKLRKAGSTAAEPENNPQNLPQVLYMENVMPTDTGVISVGYETIQAAFGGTAFDEVFILRSAEERTWYFSPANGLNYVAEVLGVDPWVSTDPIVLTGTPTVSMAYVNGRTFVCYAQQAILEWDATTEAFIDRTADLTYLLMSSVRGICGAGNYMIAFTEVTTCWSSLVNPMDFTPSAETGAGLQVPSDVRGEIKCIVQQPGGFLIHCLENTVAAFYTENPASPWKFREVKNSGGLNTPVLVTRDNSSGVYMWGTNGLQQVSLREALNQFPEVTDFFAGKILETFNYATNILTTQRLADFLFLKLSYISGRYLVISYGQAEGAYAYALVLDTALKRWGKLRVTHRDCFAGLYEARQSICFLTSNGQVQRAVLDYRNIADQGVLVMGRYQLNRTNQICSQEVELEVLDANSTVTVDVATSYNGSTLQATLPMIAYNPTGEYRCFQRQIEGENLTYFIKGSFELNTLLITATKGARF